MIKNTPENIIVNSIKHNIATRINCNVKYT